MINGINFLNQSAKVNFKGCNEEQFRTKPLEYDCFVRAENPCKKALEYAKDKIIAEIEQNDIEYGFTIDKDGTILQEGGGDKHQCSVDSRKVTPGAHCLHGHPAKLPLSSGDVSVLLSTQAQSESAITRSGQHSTLIKNHPFIDNSGYGNLYKELEGQLCLMALDELGINYELNDSDVAQIAKDYLEYSYGINLQDNTNEEVFAKLKSCSNIEHDGDCEETSTKLKERMYMQLITNPTKYDKKQSTIIQNHDEIYNFLNSDEGIKIRHEFLKRVADKYDLTYTTDLFD